MGERIRVLWAELVHWWRCGAGSWSIDIETHIAECSLCGYRYQLPHPRGMSR